MWKKFKNWYSGLPDKKRWIDVITALLSIPVLLTITWSNLSRIKSEKNNNIPSNPTPQIIVTNGNNHKEDDNQREPTSTPEVTKTEEKITSSPTPTPICKLDPQPFQINFPSEGETIKVDPVCVVLEAEKDGYCLTKWAYRINNSTWSSYTNDPICLYNMAVGNVRLEVRVKNMVSGREKTYIRNFIYQKEVQVTASPTPSVSVSPTP